MEKNILNRFLLVGIFALTIGSCDEKEDPSSVITSFDKFPVTLSSAPVVTAEADEDVLVFNFKLDPAKQLTDMHIEIGVGSSSTATEGEDFELGSHEVDVEAFAGQDGFDVEIHILEDFVDEPGNETIYLTFNTVVPSGLEKSEVLAVTIQDSNQIPLPSDEIHITADWSALDFPIEGFSGCDLADIDIYITDAGITTDFASSAGATAACPEAVTVDLAAEGNGTYLVIADLWDLAYTDLGELGPVEIPINLTFERGMTAGDEVTTFQLDQVTDIITTDDPVGAPSGFVTFKVLAEIEYQDGVYTIIDPDGNETAMRVNKAQIAEKILALRAKAGRSK
jgi:hypothetical protein